MQPKINKINKFLREKNDKKLKKEKNKTVESVVPGLVSQKLMKSVIRGSGKSSLGVVAPGQRWTVDTAFACVIPILSALMNTAHGAASESLSLLQFWFLTLELVPPQPLLCWQKEINSWDERNHINGRDDINLYSVRQISSALYLQEQETKNGMLNYSCLGLSISNTFCAFSSLTKYMCISCAVWRHYPPTCSLSPSPTI